VQAVVVQHGIKGFLTGGQPEKNPRSEAKILGAAAAAQCPARPQKRSGGGGFPFTATESLAAVLTAATQSAAPIPVPCRFQAVYR